MRNPQHVFYDGRTSSQAIFFKLKAVAFAAENSKEAAARSFNVCTKRIREWCSKQDELLKLSMDARVKRKRLDGAGRKPLDEEMEEELFQWIVKQRDRNLRVSRKMIVRKAKLGHDKSFRL